MRDFLREQYTYDSNNKTFPLKYIEGTKSYNSAVTRGVLKDGEYRAGYISSAKDENRRYVNIKVKSKCMKLHRVVWTYFNGEIPEGMTVDHIDGDILNNLIDNLQLLTPTDNKAKGSGKLYKSNSSGMKGVLWDSKLRKWKVSFRFDKKLYYFGIYSDLDKAKSVCELKLKEVKERKLCTKK